MLQIRINQKFYSTNTCVMTYTTYSSMEPVTLCQVKSFVYFFKRNLCKIVSPCFPDCFCAHFSKPPFSPPPSKQIKFLSGLFPIGAFSCGWSMEPFAKVKLLSLLIKKCWRVDPIDANLIRSATFLKFSSHTFLRDYAEKS